MNSSKQKPPPGMGARQQFKQPTSPAHQSRPGVAQLKNVASAQSVKRPVAPPVYRPQSKQVAQARLAGTAQIKTHPVAPLVYRPQLVPNVLQSKMLHQPKDINSKVKAKPPVAPLYRPQPRAGQTMMPPARPSAAQPRLKAALNSAPPVYRPQNGSRTLQPKAGSEVQVMKRPVGLVPAGPGAAQRSSVVQRQIKVGLEEYSARAAYNGLLSRQMFSYQYDSEVRRALRSIEKANLQAFQSWDSLWQEALRRAIEARPRRRRRQPLRQEAREILEPTEFEGTKELALKILREFPPEEYFYIGLGRSPTPVIAYLFRLNRDAKLLDKLGQLVINLPLSGFRPKLRSAWKNPHKLEDPLKSDQVEELYRHFDRFLPDVKLILPRKVLVIDYTQTARALIASVEHLQEYFNQKAGIFGKAPTVVPLALCVGEYVNIVKATGLENIMVVPGTLTDRSTLAYKIGGGEYYDQQAEFGAIYITKGEKTEVIGQPNSAFSDLEHDMYVRSKGYEPIP